MNFRDVCDFVWLRYPPMRVDHIGQILGWYGSNKLLGIATDGETIVGMATIRIVRKGEDGGVDYKHDKDGDIFWIDLVIADTKDALATMIYTLWDTYGRKPYIGYERKLKGKKPAVFSSRLLDKMLGRCVTAGLATHEG